MPVLARLRHQRQCYRVRPEPCVAIRPARICGGLSAGGTETGIQARCRTQFLAATIPRPGAFLRTTTSKPSNTNPESPSVPGSGAAVVVNETSSIAKFQKSALADEILTLRIPLPGSENVPVEPVSEPASATCFATLSPRLSETV